MMIPSHRGVLEYYGIEKPMGNGGLNMNRITSDPARMNGQPCVRDLRLTVRRVVQAVATYSDREELRREYPELDD